VQLLRHHAVSLSMHGRFQLKTAAPLALFWKIILLFSGYDITCCGCAPGIAADFPKGASRRPFGPHIADGPVTNAGPLLPHA